MWDELRDLEIDRSDCVRLAIARVGPFVLGAAELLDGTCVSSFSYDAVGEAFDDEEECSSFDAAQLRSVERARAAIARMGGQVDELERAIGDGA